MPKLPSFYGIAPALFSLDDAATVAYGGAPAMGAAGAGARLASWGITDLSVFITAFHNDIVRVSNHSDGFTMTRVRVRANAFAFTWGTGPALASRGRVANWTTAQVGMLVDIHGVNNRLTGNDLFSTGVVLNSCYNGGQNSWPSWRRGHAYSYIADNVRRAGGEAGTQSACSCLRQGCARACV